MEVDLRELKAEMDISKNVRRRRSQGLGHCGDVQSLVCRARGLEEMRKRAAAAAQSNIAGPQRGEILRLHSRGDVVTAQAGQLDPSAGSERSMFDGKRSDRERPSKPRSPRMGR